MFGWIQKWEGKEKGPLKLKVDDVTYVSKKK